MCVSMHVHRDTYLYFWDPSGSWDQLHGRNCTLYGQYISSMRDNVCPNLCATVSSKCWCTDQYRFHAYRPILVTKNIDIAHMCEITTGRIAQECQSGLLFFTMNGESWHESLQGTPVQASIREQLLSLAKILPPAPYHVLCQNGTPHTRSLPIFCPLQPPLQLFRAIPCHALLSSPADSCPFIHREPGSRISDRIRTVRAAYIHTTMRYLRRKTEVPT